MTGSQARRVSLAVIASAGILIGYDIVRRRLTGESAFRALWSLGLLALLLSLFADMSPRLAGPFAVLVMVALLAGHEQVLLALVGPGSPAPSAAAPARPSNLNGSAARIV